MITHKKKTNTKKHFATSRIKFCTRCLEMLKNCTCDPLQKTMNLPVFKKESQKQRVILEVQVLVYDLQKKYMLSPKDSTLIGKRVQDLIFKLLNSGKRMYEIGFEDGKNYGKLSKRT